MEVLNLADSLWVGMEGGMMVEHGCVRTAVHNGHCNHICGSDYGAPVLYGKSGE